MGIAVLHPSYRTIFNLEQTVYPKKNSKVGWVERSDTHQIIRKKMGIA
jgi:hypothetical protein